jgi:hypothetical protein
MKKYIKNGQVAVLVSRGYGAGWSTWNSIPELVFLPEVVELVLQDKREEITEELCQKALGLSADSYICVFGATGLTVEWLNEGQRFTIEEYDGAESLLTIDDLSYSA